MGKLRPGRGKGARYDQGREAGCKLWMIQTQFMIIKFALSVSLPVLSVLGQVLAHITQIKNLASLPTGCPHSWQKLNCTLANHQGHPELLARSRYLRTVVDSRHSGWVTWLVSVATGRRSSFPSSESRLAAGPFRY